LESATTTPSDPTTSAPAASTTTVDAERGVAEYFVQVEQLRGAWVDRAVPVFAARNDALDGTVGEPLDIESGSVFYHQLVELRLGFLAELSALDPPDVVVATHDEWLERQRDLIALEQRIVARLDEMDESETVSVVAGAVEFLALISEPELGTFAHNAVADRAVAVCSELEATAETHGIAADLRCGP